MEQLLKEMKALYFEGKLEVLNMKNIKKLKGKKIKTLYFGYKGLDGVDYFEVGEVISELKLAERDTNPCLMPFKNRRKYWESYLSKELLEEMGNKKALLRKDGSDTYIRSYGSFFWCSDSDREVFFTIINE